MDKNELYKVEVIFGINITRTEKRISLHQSHYVEKIKEI